MTSAVTGDSGIPADVSGPVRAGTRELRWLIDRIGADVLDRDRDRRAPHAEYALLKRLRLGALRVPAGLGGGGCSIRELFETVIELAAADPDVSHSLRNHFLFVESRARLAATGVDDPLLALALDGAIFGSAASEPDTPNIGRISTEYDSSLVPDGDGYRLNGTKVYSTGNLYADYIAVSAQDPAGQPARRSPWTRSRSAPHRCSSMSAGPPRPGRASSSTGTGAIYGRLASHNPRSYKAKWIGDYELNGTPLPTGAYF